MSPVKDRLREMQQIQYDDLNSIRTDDSQNEDKGVGQIFQKGERIRENIAVIKKNTSIANNILKNYTFKISQAKQDELDSLFKTNTLIAYKISEQLTELNGEQKKTTETTSTEYRIKSVQLSTLKQEFQDALKESSDSLEYHKNKQKDLLKKSLKAVEKDIDDAELEALLEEKKFNVFTDNVCRDCVRLVFRERPTKLQHIEKFLITTQEARQQLLDIEERHEELLKIERHLNEVLDLFMTIARLVEEQHESINRVEYHAISATDHIEQGVIDIEKTHKKKKRCNKTKLIIVVVLILFLGLILILTLR